MTNVLDFKDIPNYEGCYSISTDGTIKAIHFHSKERYLKPAINIKGYHKVKLQKDGIKLNTFVHRLVALTYIPNPLNLPIVNHKDGNKTNNHISNLEWVTDQQNVQHAWDTGLSKPRSMTEAEKDRLRQSMTGAKNPFAKKVINNDTGEVFGCVADAANSNGYKYNQLKQWLNGRRKNLSNLSYLPK